MNVVAGKNKYFVSWNKGKLEHNHTDYRHKNVLKLKHIPSEV